MSEIRGVIDKSETAKRLRVLDRVMMTLAKQRLGYADEVGRDKFHKKEEISRLDIENDRIKEQVAWANAHGMNPHFAASLMYAMISESCKLQMMHTQDGTYEKDPKNDEEWHEVLRGNLLELTKLWAESYNEQYDHDFFATRAHFAYETGLIREHISKLPQKGLAVDIGSAAGRMLFEACTDFEKTVGFDLSPDMIGVAQKTAKEKGLGDRFSFKVADAEERLPLEGETADFVMLNLGSASDIRDADHVVAEVERILKPGGRFFLSFYNKDALLYQWDFLPWPVGLAATINPHKHSLDVHVDDRVLSIHARPYSTEEIQGLMAGAKKLRVTETKTHPTISALLPQEVFEGERAQHMQQSVANIDRSLVDGSAGAYILVGGEKRRRKAKHQA